ncbi:protein-glutamate O-methyltransferase CheR [Bacillus sp. 31A1R]|uniref:Protein-glutamate O-methyltransferase CheR n=1 Tax=Robertmurraya mangrovi TaxID=3098077 RepID=A0ABU5IWZ0_9BACI|nr:protein-glutamate O-methyltransferase CheR [Bacillus sp. 31A1R]MDZ5471631.1 protein-glutamate O-methyltransferase CheR [Bacillus sp. 31A1R]
MNDEKKYESLELKECSELEKLEIHLLLEGVYRHYGLDFRNYAFTSIRRRIWYRMKAEKIETVTSLLDRLLHDRKLMEKLYYDFSINVTEMFRDPSFFRTLRTTVLPALKKLSKIRIWHAGCSTGEEPFSMAILLKEEGLLEKTYIYATDMNDQVLEKAKLGKFPLKKMKSYTSNYVQSGGLNDFSEYYTVSNEHAVFSKELSKNIFFAQHNLVTDGSFNEFHIIICRNVLIYFDKQLQSRVHQLFFNSLTTDGYLGLGNREGISFTGQEKNYKIINEKEKIYQKI